MMTVAKKVSGGTCVMKNPKKKYDRVDVSSDMTASRKRTAY